MTRQPEEIIHAAELASEFREAHPEIRCWAGGFYEWAGARYYELTKGDLKARIVAHLHEQPMLRHKIGARLVDDIILILTGTYIDARLTPPIWIDSQEPAPNIMPVHNGLLEISRTGKVQLLPHSSQLFTLTALPYSYDPAADCPLWKRILGQNIPDPGTQGLIQEWFGYHLLADTRFEAFMLWEGHGSNGKSVAVTVLKAFLGGKSNVSAVNLEQFSATRGYQLAELEGKLANIVSELNEVDKVQEGILKQIVSGEYMTVERKYRDPHGMEPFAKITFAANNLPNFTDRSYGLWRRMLLVKFDQTIADKDKDRRFNNPRFWEQNGELPGILNWAIDGLQRLLARGGFEEPQAVKAAKEAYRLEQNPAQLFLTENYEYDPDSDSKDWVVRSEVYSAYREWAPLEATSAILKATSFNREIGKVFPQAQPGQSRRNGTKKKVWCNLVPKTDVKSEVKLHAIE